MNEFYQALNIYLLPVLVVIYFLIIPFAYSFLFHFCRFIDDDEDTFQYPLLQNSPLYKLYFLYFDDIPAPVIGLFALIISLFDVIFSTEGINTLLFQFIVLTSVLTTFGMAKLIRKIFRINKKLENSLDDK